MARAPQDGGARIGSQGLTGGRAPGRAKILLNTGLALAGCSGAVFGAVRRDGMRRGLAGVKTAAGVRMLFELKISSFASPRHRVLLAPVRTPPRSLLYAPDSSHQHPFRPVRAPSQDPRRSRGCRLPVLYTDTGRDLADCARWPRCCRSGSDRHRENRCLSRRRAATPIAARVEPCACGCRSCARAAGARSGRSSGRSSGRNARARR